MPDFVVQLKNYPKREYGWFARVPALPFCMSEGRTKAEVLRNVREAIECHLHALAKGIPVKRQPRPRGVVVRVRVPLRLVAS